MLEFDSVDEAFWFGYCVGLYEGEGMCAIWSVKSNPDRKYGRFVVRMTDPEPIQNLKRVLGGVAMGPYLTPGERLLNRKPKYRWTLGRVDDVIRLAARMTPFLSARRASQVKRVLDEVSPRVRQQAKAGNRRNGELPVLRPRHTGELVCPAEPEPSARGYQRHRLLGIPCCDVCRESFRLYYAERRKWNKDKVRETNRAQYLKNREARVLQAREHRARKKQEGKSSEITD